MQNGSMKWNRWYVAKSYLSSALWTVPFFALVMENVAIRIIFGRSEWLGWLPWFGMTAAGTTDALNTAETMNASFIVFTFSSILIAIQVASGQLTPRIIATTLLRDNVIRWTVGLFTFTMLFAIGTRARLDNSITHPAITITWGLGIVSIAAFLFLIDYTARLLRPISIVWRISEDGIKVINSIYPASLEAALPPREYPRPQAVSRTVDHEGRSGCILAINLKALISLAQRVDGVIELVPRVGDFVAVGDALFHLYGPDTVRIDDRMLRAQVAFGRERTIEQDSTFAFRVIVDVGIKALSPAINDPTTAVLAIDQIHRLLRLVGRRHLHDDALFDGSGALRVIFPTPNWEDFVRLAVSELRLYGAGNFQVSRRLLAMLENLLDSLAENRWPELLHERNLLNQMLERLHIFPEDLALARQPDFQGLGGSSSRKRSG
jgi:uncharacterized membrane protein